MGTKDWVNSIAITTKIAITKCHATTAYDRFNQSIINIIEFDDTEIPTMYDPLDFFQIFDEVFNIDWQILNVVDTVRFQYFLNIYSQLVSVSIEDADARFRLRSLFAVALILYNNAFLGDGELPNDLGSLTSVVKQEYKVSDTL